MYGHTPPFGQDDEDTVLRMSVEVTEAVCQATPMLAFGRKCGCKLARLSLSPALQAAAARAGVKISDGELVCMGGRACGLNTGLRLSALRELLR